MTPLREYRSLKNRFDEDLLVDPLKRFYLIFEGVNTEKKYFYGIANNRKELDISNYIELVILDKEGDINSFSHPKKLLELINEKKNELKRDGKYDNEIDRFAIVFDRDSFERVEDYINFVEQAKDNYILVVTNPCFELWLILHYEDAIFMYIEPNRESFVNVNPKMYNY